jgi:hypothetical protein
LPFDQDVVVRFGTSSVAALRRNAAVGFAVTGVYSWSVFSLPGLSGDEIAASLPEDFKFAVYRETTVGRLRAAGYDLSGCDDRGHCDVALQAEPTDDQCRDFGALFGTERADPRQEGHR